MKNGEFHENISKTMSGASPALFAALFKHFEIQIPKVEKPSDAKKQEEVIQAIIKSIPENKTYDVSDALNTIITISRRTILAALIAKLRNSSADLTCLDKTKKNYDKAITLYLAHTEIAQEHATVTFLHNQKRSQWSIRTDYAPENGQPLTTAQLEPLKVRITEKLAEVSGDQACIISLITENNSQYLVIKAAGAAESIEHVKNGTPDSVMLQPLIYSAIVFEPRFGVIETYAEEPTTQFALHEVFAEVIFKKTIPLKPPNAPVCDLEAVYAKIQTGKFAYETDDDAPDIGDIYLKKLVLSWKKKSVRYIIEGMGKSRSKGEGYNDEIYIGLHRLIKIDNGNVAGSIPPDDLSLTHAEFVAVIHKEDGKTRIKRFTLSAGNHTSLGYSNTDKQIRLWLKKQQYFNREAERAAA
jgi:hypothetical protein